MKQIHYRCSGCHQPCDIYISYDDTQTEESDILEPDQCFCHEQTRKPKFVRIRQITKIIKKKRLKKVIPNSINIGEYL